MKKILLTTILPLFCLALFAQDSTEVKPYFYKDSIKLVDVAPFNYVCYVNTGSHQKIGSAFTTLWEESVKQFLPYQVNTWFTIYHNSPENTQEDSLKWDVCISLENEYEGDEILEPLKREKWEYKQVVSLIYDGPLGSKQGPAYQALGEWNEKNSYQIVGPNLIKNLSRPQMNDKGEMVGRIEIWYPVAKK